MFLGQHLKPCNRCTHNPIDKSYDASTTFVTCASSCACSSRQTNHNAKCFECYTLRSRLRCPGTIPTFARICPAMSSMACKAFTVNQGPQPSGCRVTTRLLFPTRQIQANGLANVHWDPILRQQVCTSRSEDTSASSKCLKMYRGLEPS